MSPAHPQPELLLGDARALPVADGSVDLVVTSPPYYAQRSYKDDGEHYEGQIGQEDSPQAYVDSLIDVTRECMRVLKPTGSLWVNLGDKYVTSAPGHLGKTGSSRTYAREGYRTTLGHGRTKSLLGLPWRYALACLDDLGLILRAEVIWSKPNGVPESVRDRVRRSHEQWFHFTLQPRYYSAVDELREPISNPANPQVAQGRSLNAGTASGGPAAGRNLSNPLGKIPSSVWNVSTQPLKVPAELGVEHFAAFPMELPRRIITGWSPRHVCTGCGEGRRPVPTEWEIDTSRPQARRAVELFTAAGLTEEHLDAVRKVGLGCFNYGAQTQNGGNSDETIAMAQQVYDLVGSNVRELLQRRVTAFDYVCSCADTSAPTTPGVVLDPFSGTGTTALIASALGRRGISVDASADYKRLAEWRCSDPQQQARAIRLTSDR